MTIHQLKHPCFVLDPSPYGDDDYGVPHYATQGKGAEALKELREEREPDPEGLARLKGVQVRQEDAPCWVAECDYPGCEEPYEDDEAGGSHFESAETLTEWLRQDGWTTEPPDRVLCWSDSPEDAPKPLPDSAEQEAAGQLRLDGAA